MKTGVSVADAMSVNPVTISGTKSVLECAKIMMKKRVGSLLIVKEDQLEGIITEKDFVHFLAKGLNPETIKAKEIMVTKIHAIAPEEDLSEAIIKMKREKVRRLPVVNKNKLIGMLTLNDIIKLQPTLFEVLREQSNIRLQKKKEKTIEGTCEVCENFGKLYEIDDQFICVECRSEKASRSSDEE